MLGRTIFGVQVHRQVGSRSEFLAVLSVVGDVFDIAGNEFAVRVQLLERTDGSVAKVAVTYLAGGAVSSLPPLPPGTKHLKRRPNPHSPPPGTL